jgi:hypothetical protein
MAFPSIRIEGGLIPADLLDEIASGGARGQDAADFHLDHHTRLSDEIAAAWADARAYWHAFQRALDRLPEHDTGTSPTRQLWAIPLLYALGYEQVTFMRQAEVLDGRSYAISHRAGDDESAPPVHIEGAGTSLDQRPPSGRPRLSPHGLLQEYLNHSEHVWGIVTNGLRLRLIRDNALMSRQSYIEFDLEAMLGGEHFADFGVMYRLVHRTRLPRSTDDAPHCLLEQYFQHGVEQGGRVREHLREGVEDALLALGNGFLAHPKSAALRQRVADGSLTPLDYYRQLLRLIYRLLFLLVSEERGLIGPADQRLRRIYDGSYSVSRLRKLVETRLSSADRYHDLWIGLAQTTFRIHEDADIAARIGMGALDGDLFGPHAIPDLRDAYIMNADLLRAMRRLVLWQDGKVLRRVNYAALDVEELGSVYESLLDFHPTIRQEGRGPVFGLATGTERKTTGSYYTRPELVHELIKSALEPVMADRLKEAGSDPQARERALLGLTVCDPACGSGHFLLAAARRIGRDLATVRTGEAHPAPEAMRVAIRDTIRHCIYGVDKNPLAVDLCKVALWLEGHSRDLPLSFLDHRIKCGDSLVGVFDLDALRQGIPDGAYSAVTGDDKKIASGFRKQNKQEREGQLGLFGPPALPQTDVLADLMRRFAREREDTPDDVRRKADTYARSRGEGTPWWRLTTACHLWTAAFFVPFRAEMRERVPTTETLRRYLAHGGVDGRIVGWAHQLAADNRFFHWPLEFPEVFAPLARSTGEGPGVRTGFDVVLGNPPWDVVKAEDSAQAHAVHKVKEWFKNGQYSILRGRRDLYKLFIAQTRHLVSSDGRAALVTPVGFFFEDDGSDLRRELYLTESVPQLQHFQNHRKQFFPDVDTRYRFAAITFSPSPRPDHRFSTVIRAPDEISEAAWIRVGRKELERDLGEDLAAVLFPSRKYAETHSRIISHLKRATLLTTDVVAEFHATSDGTLIYSSPQNLTDWRVLKNRNIHQFTHCFSGADQFVSWQAVQEKCLQKGIDPRTWMSPDALRLLFRDIARNDDARTLICCLAPVGSASSYDTPMIVPTVSSIDDLHQVLAYLCGVLNSFTFDFLVRPFVDKHIKGYVLRRLPVPAYSKQDAEMTAIADRVLVLSDLDCQHALTEEAQAQIRAELDARVARLAGLSQTELEFVLSTFPIIEKEDWATHHEFRTRRLVLAAWERLGF